MTTKLATHVRAATVPLTDAAGLLLGTAFFVAPGVAVTAAHVVHDAPDDLVFAPDRQGVQRALKVWNKHPQTIAPGLDPLMYPLPDLAIVAAQPGMFDDMPCVLLGPPGTARELTAIGHSRRSIDLPGSFGPDVATFTFEAILEEQGIDLLKVKLGAVDPGMSGAPVLDHDAGRVVGVVKATRGAGKPHGAYVVAAATLQRLEHEVWALNELHHRKNPAWRSAVAGDFDGPDPVAATREILHAVIHEVESQRDTMPEGIDAEALHQTIWLRRRSPGPNRVSGESVPIRQRWRTDRAMPSLTVVSGDPGFGKSWLIKHQVRYAAHQAVAQLDAGGSLDDCIIPVRLTCTTLAAENDHGTGLRGLARTLVAATLSPAKAEDGDVRGYVAVAERALTDGRVFLCVDGLDEMPTSLAGRLKQVLVTLLAVNNTLLVTSRPAALAIIDEIAVGNREDFQLVGFSSREVVNFVNTWLHDRSDAAESLLAAIGNRPELAQLAEVPLLLSFLCRLAEPAQHQDYRRSTLPQLYHDVALHLLSGQWHRIPADREAMPDAILRMRVLAEVLGELQDSWRCGVEDIPKAELRAAISRHPDYDVVAATAKIRMTTRVQSARNPIADVAEPVVWELLYDGILMEAGDISMRPTVRFIHPILRETLLAAYVAGLTLDEQRHCIDRHRWMDASWTRVFVTAASRVSDPAALVAHILAEEGDPWVTQRTLAAQIIAEVPDYRDEASAEAVRDAILAATQSPLVFERRRALDALGILLRSPLRPLRDWAAERAAALEGSSDDEAGADVETEIAYVAMSSLLDARDEAAARRARALVTAEDCPQKLRLRLIAGLVALDTRDDADLVRQRLDHQSAAREELTAFLAALRPHSRPAVTAAIRLLRNRRMHVGVRLEIGRVLLECGATGVEAVRDTAGDRSMEWGLRCRLYADLIRAAVPDVVGPSLRLLAASQPRYDDRAELTLALIEDGVTDAVSHAAYALANRHVSWTVRQSLARALARQGDAGRDLLAAQLDHGGVALELKLRHVCALTEVQDQRGLTAALTWHSDVGVPAWIRLRVAESLMRSNPSLADEEALIHLATFDELSQPPRLELITEMARHGLQSAETALRSVLRERSDGAESWPDASKRLAEAGRLGLRCLEAVARDPDLQWSVRCDAVLAVKKTSGAPLTRGVLADTVAAMPPTWYRRLVLGLARNGLAPDLSEFVSIARAQRSGYRIIFEFLRRAAVDLGAVRDLVATATELQHGQTLEEPTGERISLGPDLLTEVGIEYRSEAEARQILDWISSRLEERVGMKTAKLMLAEQIDEFGVFIGRNDQAGALSFLEHEFPEYRQIVDETYAEIKEQLRSGAIRPPRPDTDPGPGSAILTNISLVAAVLSEWVTSADARRWDRWDDLTVRNAELIGSALARQILRLSASFDAGWGRYEAAEFVATLLARGDASMVFEHSNLIDWLKGRLEEGGYADVLYGGAFAVLRFEEYADSWLYAAVGAEQCGEHDLALSLVRWAGQYGPPAEKQNGTATLEQLQLSLGWSDTVAAELVKAYHQGVETTPLSAYERAVAREPTSSVNHFNLGIALQRAGRHAEAVDAYRRSVELLPDARRRRALAHALSETGAHDQALVEVDMALELDRSDHLAHGIRGGILMGLDRLTEAVEAYGEASRLAPANPYHLANLGYALRAVDRNDEAMELLRRAVALQPKAAQVRRFLAYAQLDAGHPEDALVTITEALAIDPADAITHDAHGVVLNSLGRYAEAAETLAEAVRLNPAMSGSRANHAEALILLGRLAEAEQELREAVRLGPNNDIEAAVMLAIAVHPRDPGEAGDLARRALTYREQPNISPFRHGELRSVARLLIGDTDGAVAEIRQVANRRRPGDSRQEPLYDLLRSLLGMEPVGAVIDEWPSSDQT
ncbi:tetratricopeptide repeat protein [Micromonospora sediminicola]|uniref:tetratricopeptide repeat protein n=1 Tax=Micromonospora sediminicola TaxID=946078 RepID=UPI0033BE794C